ncbi:hypothetical protein QTP88_011830 [Uroleucon formosanum]
MPLARRSNKNKGGGLTNTLINKLPIELHVPGYQYCGPGTNLKKRLARGDKGINLLDYACREHDIAYEQSNSIADRNKADYILEQRAWDRFKSKDSGLKKKLWLGVDRLSKSPKRQESAIINLDTRKGTGTHWVAYKKIGKKVEYYDSFGNLPPPIEMPDYVSMFELKANSRTLKCMISCSHDVDLGVENSIAKLLSFRNVLYTTDATNESENIVNIMKINCIKVECNLITGSFCDRAPSQIIHQLYPTVPAGFKIVEVPRHPVFYGLNATSIIKVNIVLKDQNDCLINLCVYIASSEEVQTYPNQSHKKQFKFSLFFTMMDDSYLDVTADYIDDCKITQKSYHSFTPYSSTALSYNEKIRINVQNMDSYTLLCESYIYIEGKINKPTDAIGEVRFSNNGLAFLFSKMRYEINGIEIQKLKSPGVSSCLKAYCSYTPNDLNALENAAWD